MEILDFLDSREHTIGAKRNWLLDRARGEFVAFVDDDDDVSERYVDLIRHAIEDHPEIDCVGIKGTISFRGRIERTFVHSIRFRDYRSRGGTYQRPPYHLNPIRREIARRYRFADVSYSEDVDWAMMMCRDGALGTSSSWMRSSTTTIRGGTGTTSGCSIGPSSCGMRSGCAR